MAHANQDCLGHSGSTDVITLDYREGQPMPGDDGMVELLICPDQALSEGHRQGGYPREMVLYIVHGLLHASGEDDLSPLPRRRMRRREREVLSQLEKEFDFDKIFQTPKES
ncbi:MAG: rRNA maturation RNase YbeY [Lentisphaerae bacterium GWF2_52_8]|nr:MAG: rRNA maturation RNase YbeY [Lentisphaerae bacterium GWF2_52_8]